MEYKNFSYKLIRIYQTQPEQMVALPMIPFTYDYDTIQKPDGTILKVKSQAFFDFKGAKLLYGESEYFLPSEQPNPNLGDLVFSELIYQHLARQADVVYNISEAHILLTIPTIKSILENMVASDN